MKAVAEIVVAIILLVSSGYLAPKAVDLFKIETIQKVNQGLPSLSGFSEKLGKPWSLEDDKCGKINWINLLNLSISSSGESWK